MYFYANAADGGLHIPLMICKILIIRKARYEMLLTSQDPGIQSLRRTDEFHKAYTKITTRITLWNGQPISSKESLKQELRSCLLTSVDGRGLEMHSHVNLHKWSTNGTLLMSGAMFIGITKIQGNLMPIKSDKQEAVHTDPQLAIPVEGLNLWDILSNSVQEVMANK